MAGQLQLHLFSEPRALLGLKPLMSASYIADYLKAMRASASLTHWRTSRSNSLLINRLLTSLIQ